MNDKENIVKKVCKELNITQKGLSEKLDIPESTISGWVNVDIPRMTKIALELIIENRKLESKLNIFKQAFDIAKSL